MTLCARASTKWVLPVPRGSGDGEVLGAADPFQGGQPGLGAGRDRGVGLAPGLEGLPGRESGGFAAHPAGGVVAAADLLGDQHPQDLGGVPALRPGGGQHLGCGVAQVGQPHPLEHREQLLGQRGCRAWWRSAWDVAWSRGRGGHQDSSPSVSSAGAEAGPGAGAGLHGVVLVGDHQGRDRGAVGAVVHDREQVALGEPSRRRGDTQRGVDRFGARPGRPARGRRSSSTGPAAPRPRRPRPARSAHPARGRGTPSPRCCGPWAAAASGTRRAVGDGRGSGTGRSAGSPASTAGAGPPRPARSPPRSGRR